MKIFRTTTVGRRCCAAQISTRANGAAFPAASLRSPAGLGQSGSFALPVCKQSAFTLVEIAISLAVIGIALVAIIGVLPLGMNTQRDNREATVINQDATVFIEAIHNGARGMDDLTNYVYAIVNTGTSNGYTSPLAAQMGFQMSSYPSIPANQWFSILTNGANIVGLLSTPQFTDNFGNPANDFFNGGYSNHIVAYVRSISGPAVEKPPQDNQIIQADSFGYRVIFENAPVATYAPSFWQSGSSYNQGDSVSYLFHGQTTYWQATASSSGAVPPNSPSLWARILYPQELADNLHELRLSFLWPVQPNGAVGGGRQTFRLLVAGQIVTNIVAGNYLYFFQSQSFTNAP
jgi:prepilin-type N-terminal cleavage/methylation domain-containing protein